MGKRSDFDRKSKDFYVTPIEAIWPLLGHLPLYFVYIDPCCGTGAIPKALTQLTTDCYMSAHYDLYEHKGFSNKIADATTHKYCDCPDDMIFITNPPWDRSKKNGEILHKIIDNLAGQKPTWLLFDSDWAFTKQSAAYMKHCVKMVAVGRVKWFEDSEHTGKDNCAWYLFDKNHTGPTEFVGR